VNGARKNGGMHDEDQRKNPRNKKKRTTRENKLITIVYDASLLTKDLYTSLLHCGTMFSNTPPRTF